MKNDDGWVYKSADIGEGSLKNSKKVLTYFMDGPTRMVTWSLSLTSNMFPLTDAHKSIMCATVYIVHHIVRLKLLCM